MDIRNKTCNNTENGVDLNRNYGFNFGVGGRSSSNTECQGSVYRGPYAFSEPETRAIRDFLTNMKEKISFVTNFHTRGKEFNIPMSSTIPNTINNTSQVIG